MTDRSYAFSAPSDLASLDAFITQIIPENGKGKVKFEELSEEDQEVIISMILFFSKSSRIPFSSIEIKRILWKFNIPTTLFNENDVYLHPQTIKELRNRIAGIFISNNVLEDFTRLDESAKIEVLNLLREYYNQNKRRIDFDLEGFLYLASWYRIPEELVLENSDRLEQ